jgi:hypothetical protein
MGQPKLMNTREEKKTATRNIVLTSRNLLALSLAMSLRLERGTSHTKMSGKLRIPPEGCSDAIYNFKLYMNDALPDACHSTPDIAIYNVFFVPALDGIISRRGLTM